MSFKSENLLNVKNNHETLSGFLKPEPGYELDFMVGTTYTLQTWSLLKFIYALNIQSSVEEDCDGEDVPKKIPELLLHILEKYEDKIIIFHEEGAVNCKKIDPVWLESLEPYLIPVSAPESTFHPKFWYASYSNENGGKTDRKYKLVVMSKNLSEYTSLECFAGFEGELKDEPNEFSKSVLSFLDFLGNNTDKHKEKIKSIATDIKTVSFAKNTEASFHWQGLNNKGKSLEGLIFEKDELPAKIMIVSPFLFSDFSFNEKIEKKLLENPKSSDIDDEITQKMKIISTRESLNKFCPNLKEDVNGLYVMEDIPIERDFETDENDDSEESDDEILAHSLHAKIYLIEREEGETELILGSANFTGLGLGINTNNRNCEAVVKIKLGKSAKFNTVVQNFFKLKDKMLVEVTQSCRQDKEGGKDDWEKKKRLKKIISWDWKASYESDDAILRLEVENKENIERVLEIKNLYKDKKLERDNNTWIIKNISENNIGQFFKFELKGCSKTISIPIQGLKFLNNQMTIAEKMRSQIKQKEFDHFLYLMFLFEDTYRGRDLYRDVLEDSVHKSASGDETKVLNAEVEDYISIEKIVRRLNDSVFIKKFAERCQALEKNIEEIEDSDNKNGEEIKQIIKFGKMLAEEL